MFNSTLYTCGMLPISNPLSAMTESPASKRSKIPLHLVIYLSLIPPVYKVETKHIASQGSFGLYLLQKKIEIEMEVVAPFL